MVIRTPRHEPAPALQAMMLDYMNATPWGDNERPRMLFVYTDRISDVPLPQRALEDHPRVMVRRFADIMEEARREGTLSAKPADLVGAGMMFHMWEAALTPEERPHWKTRNLGEHPRAVESRMLIVHQPGYRPVAALHHRDRRGTGVELACPVPALSEEPFVPGGAAPPLLIHLERLCRARAPGPGHVPRGPEVGGFRGVRPADRSGPIE